jgi:hypothetical protein
VVGSTLHESIPAFTSGCTVETRADFAWSLQAALRQFSVDLRSAPAEFSAQVDSSADLNNGAQSI